MRVSTDPTDPAYVDDRPRRAWCNDVEITNWSVADEFRRCVIDKDGKVYNGSVRVERLPPPELIGARPVADRIAELEADPARAPLLAQARKAKKRR